MFLSLGMAAELSVLLVDLFGHWDFFRVRGRIPWDYSTSHMELLQVRNVMHKLIFKFFL